MLCLIDHVKFGIQVALDAYVKVIIQQGTQYHGFSYKLFNEIICNPFVETYLGLFLFRLKSELSLEIFISKRIQSK